MRLKLKETGSELDVATFAEEMDMLEIVDEISFMLDK